jgi:chitinase
VAVAVNPQAADLYPGASQTFTASVTGAANQAVVWSVQEGATGGTITNGGVYTAPAIDGTYHVVATSQQDPSKQTAVTVTVRSGNVALGVD